MLLHTWVPATSPSFFPGLFFPGIKEPQRISKSVIFFVVITSCSALKGTNNAAYSLPLYNQRFIFYNFFFFGRCVERTQERLITLLSLSKKKRKLDLRVSLGDPLRGGGFVSLSLEMIV